MLSRLACVLLFGLTIALPARAYTPESGVWWNPDEPGTGIFIEIQDNFLVAAAYTYDTVGNAQWYTATGFMTGNARFDGVLDAFDRGNCPGCAYRPNREFLGAGGPITLIFDPDDGSRATLTWGGRSMPIERFQFYLKRPEDQQALPSVRIELTKMLGEWQTVIDFSENQNVSSQFYGDITVLDRLDADSAADFVEGCRPVDSLRGFCRNEDVRDHRATLEYVRSSNEQVLLVDNDRDTYAAYFLTTGTNQFTGEVAVYFKGSNPSVFYPVRGFRSASRSFVQEGIGPSKQDAPSRAARSLPVAWFSADGVQAKQISAERLAALRSAEQRLQRGKTVTRPR